MSKPDWAGLEIACGGDARRLGVWRSGKVSIKGDGDFENVRVEREAVMKAFPEPPASESEVRSLIRLELEKRGGFFSQENGAQIVRAVFPDFPKKQAMALVKEATGNLKRGPRGPRKKLCG